MVGNLFVYSFIRLLKSIQIQYSNLENTFMEKDEGVSMEKNDFPLIYIFHETVPPRN